MNLKYSSVKIRETNEFVKVNITSDTKPDIAKPLIEKWQSLIDTAAKIVNVPSALIMKLNEDNIEVFLKSNTPGNPYKTGEKADLVYGLYCESVIGTQKPVCVPDALKSPVWKFNNPDIELNMISYLGFPLNWPDGEVFGTVCLLDSKENFYNPDFQNLLSLIQSHIETDLDVILKNYQLEQLNSTKSKFLSLISHDVRGKLGIYNEYLSVVLDDFDGFEKPEIKKILHNVSKQSNIISQTLESLLQWSKNDMLQLKPDFKILNLVDIITITLDFFSDTIELKNISVSKDFYSDNVSVFADEIMLSSSFRNIISNAVKFVDDNGSISLRIFSSPGSEIVLEIEDNGAGMDETTLNKIFSYNKIDSANSSRNRGAGIGLILAKEFLDKNNASVSVESRIDKGTKFSISFPAP